MLYMHTCHMHLVLHACMHEYPTLYVHTWQHHLASGSPLECGISTYMYVTNYAWLAHINGKYPCQIIFFALAGSVMAVPNSNFLVS